VEQIRAHKQAEPKGNMYPFAVEAKLPAVNRKLLDAQIRCVYEELVGQGGSLGGRSLRAALMRGFGSGGKTDWIYAL